MSILKRVAVPVIILVVVIAGALWVRWLLGQCQEPRITLARQSGPPRGWHTVDEERTSSVLEKINPLHRPTKADVVMKDWPAGSRVVHVETEGGEHVELGILPGGEVAVPEGQKHEVTVYHKPEPAVALELRPFVGAGLSIDGPGFVAGVDVVRAWRIHLGPAVAVSWPDGEVAAVGTVSYNAWRNIDLCAGGGYGTAGGTAHFGASLAIE